MAGGFEHRGYWLDAHSGGIPDALLDVARVVLPRLPNVRALLFEVVPSAMHEFGTDGVQRQLEVLWELWEARGTVFDPTASARPVASGPGSGSTSPLTSGIAPQSPREWEETLGALVVGRPVTGSLAEELSADPGVSLLRDLVFELRASALASTLKLTCRLLLLRLGEEGFRSLLADYADQVTPHAFASDEAEAFGRFLNAADVDVPHLREVLAFELSVVATLIDGIPRSTRFEFEPISLLRALGEGRLPGPVAPGLFEIEVTGDESTGDLDEYLARASYWPH